MNIRQVVFPESQYIKEEFPKSQIYLHHTAGNSSGVDVYSSWARNPERIATCVVISGKGARNSGDGEIIQGFSSRFWAFHLGLKSSTFTSRNIPYQPLDKTSIGIELCNWGQLTYKKGKFYNYVNSIVPESEVCELESPFKGFKFYHDYTDAQIESTQLLLEGWRDRYNIPLIYNNDIWDISTRALRNDPGVFTHNSVRTDKVDVYPNPKLVKMLQSLK